MHTHARRNPKPTDQRRRAARASARPSRDPSPAAREHARLISRALEKTGAVASPRAVNRLAAALDAA